MNKLVEYIDVAVIGAGHAGCEASLAAARLGLETMVFTVSVDSIAMMPCNPNIGGTSKGGQKVRISGTEDHGHPVKRERTGCAGRRNGKGHR